MRASKETSLELQFVEEWRGDDRKTVPKIIETNPNKKIVATYNSIGLQRVQIDLTNCEMCGGAWGYPLEQRSTGMKFINAKVFGTGDWKILGWKKIIPKRSPELARLAELREGSLSLGIYLKRVNFEDTHFTDPFHIYSNFETDMRTQIKTANCAFTISGDLGRIEIKFPIDHRIYDQIYDLITDNAPLVTPSGIIENRYKLMEGSKLKFVVFPEGRLSGLYVRPEDKDIYLLSDLNSISSHSIAENAPDDLSGVITSKHQFFPFKMQYVLPNTWPRNTD